MVTFAKWMGATFSLVMTVGTLVGAVATIIEHWPVLMFVSCLGLAAIAGYMVYNDWSTVWGPLLSGKKPQ